jgi:hypothetical protein
LTAVSPLPVVASFIKAVYGVANRSKGRTGRYLINRRTIHDNHIHGSSDLYTALPGLSKKLQRIALQSVQIFAHSVKRNTGGTNESTND